MLSGAVYSGQPRGPIVSPASGGSNVGPRRLGDDLLAPVVFVVVRAGIVARVGGVRIEIVALEQHHADVRTDVVVERADVEVAVLDQWIEKEEPAVGHDDLRGIPVADVFDSVSHLLRAPGVVADDVLERRHDVQVVAEKSIEAEVVPPVGVGVTRPWADDLGQTGAAARLVLAADPLTVELRAPRAVRPDEVVRASPVDRILIGPAVLYVCPARRIPALVHVERGNAAAVKDDRLRNRVVGDRAGAVSG